MAESSGHWLITCQPWPIVPQRRSLAKRGAGAPTHANLHRAVWTPQYLVKPVSTPAVLNQTSSYFSFSLPAGVQDGPPPPPPLFSPPAWRGLWPVSTPNRSQHHLHVWPKVSLSGLPLPHSLSSQFLSKAEVRCHHSYHRNWELGLGVEEHLILLLLP